MPARCPLLSKTAGMGCARGKQLSASFFVDAPGLPDSTSWRVLRYVYMYIVDALAVIPFLSRKTRTRDRPTPTLR